MSICAYIVALEREKRERGYRSIAHTHIYLYIVGKGESY